MHHLLVIMFLSVWKTADHLLVCMRVELATVTSRKQGLQRASRACASDPRLVWMTVISPFNEAARGDAGVVRPPLVSMRSPRLASSFAASSDTQLASLLVVIAFSSLLGMPSQHDIWSMFAAME
jgi:hypothetical protein